MPENEKMKWIWLQDAIEWEKLITLCPTPSNMGVEKIQKGETWQHLIACLEHRSRNDEVPVVLTKALVPSNKRTHKYTIPKG